MKEGGRALAFLRSSAQTPTSMTHRHAAAAMPCNRRAVKAGQPGGMHETV